MKAPPSPPDPRLGQVLRNRYEIRSILGTGGMGRTYRAHDREANRPVVVKVVHGVDERNQDLLFREARVLEAIDSPFVDPTLEYFRESGEGFLVRAFVDGETLREWQQDPKPVPVILEAYANIASGLAATHRRDVVHRDLKPSNVLVTEAPDVRILDFGLAVVTSERDTLTATATSVVGTPAFMSPEMWGGENVGPAVDVFSFGVMLHETLAGVLPWRTDDIRETALAISRGRFDLTHLPIYASSELRELIARCLAPDPTDRPTAEELARFLAEEAGRPEYARALAPVSPPAESDTVTATIPGEVFVPAGGGMPAPAAPAPAPEPEPAPLPTASAPRAAPRPAAGALAAGLGVVGIALAFVLWRISVPGAGSSPGAGSAAGRLHPLVLFGFGALAVLVGYVSRRFESRREAASPLLEARLRAIERKVKKAESMSESVALEISEMRPQFDTEEVRRLVRESVVATLGEMDIGRPSHDLETVLHRLITSLAPKPKPKRPWYASVSGWLTTTGTAVSAVGGILAFAANAHLWSPNEPPEIRAFAANRDRAMRGVPLEFSVDASDADGDRLRYEYTASFGTIEAAGPLMVWRSDSEPPGRILEVAVSVSDGRDAVTTSRSIRINDAPVVVLRLPESVGDSSTATLRAEGTDPDGDPLTYSWNCSRGELHDADRDVAILRNVGGSDLVEVSCRVSDGWEEVVLTAKLNPRGDRP